MSKNSKKRRIHYVLSSHWDREWYQTFQNFRWRLVGLLDGVLDGWNTGQLQGSFQTDGQAIMLEDYLEVRPEKRNEIENRAREGKLVIGPWYVLPDEFLVSGESLVRNLRYGREVARSLGGTPSNAGFVCDLFGHISQLPQILFGFSIRGGLLWRGLNHLGTRHVIWRGADGTELPCYKFGRNGYCDYAFEVRHASEGDQSYDADATDKDLAAHIEQELELTKLDPVLLFDGGDHQEWDTDVYTRLMAHFNDHADEIEGIHSSLDRYLEEMLLQADCISDCVEGELREPARHPARKDQAWLIPGVLSSRVEIKQANAECQSLLCRWAEPLSTLASLTLGTMPPDGFLALAWKWLLKNHPHDSICGCSIDAVHEDMRFRFAQCRQIAERVAIESAFAIAANVEGSIGAKEMRVTVFNPLPRVLKDNVDIKLQIPAEWPTFAEFFGFEDKPAFRIYDEQGQEIPYQRVGQDLNRTKNRLPATKFPQEFKTDDVDVTLPLEIPPLGHTSLTIRPGEVEEATRHLGGHGLVLNGHTLENEAMRVAVQPNGTIVLTDKVNGQVYERLLTLEDSADIGDGWFHGMTVNDVVYTSAAAHADIALVSDGPYVAALKVRVHLGLPENFGFERMQRSEKHADLTVEHLLRLRAGATNLEVETTVHNTVRNHRLRVLFPTQANAATYLADSAFDVVERPIALRPDNFTYRELEVETKPQQSWTAVFDADRGLAVISTGLHETAVRDLPERPLALTLFRATQQTVGTDGEPGGQLQKTLSFRYRIKPLVGEPDRVELLNLGQHLAAGLRNVQLTAKDIRLYERGHASSSASRGHTVPATVGFLEVEGGAILTSLRQVEGGLEARLFNPEPKATQATLKFSKRAGLTEAVQYVQRVDLESRPIEMHRLMKDGTCTVRLKPKEIVTLRMMPQLPDSY